MTKGPIEGLDERRFRELTGVGDEPVELVSTGWNKDVLLTHDRAFLFPREARFLEWFERELAVYATVRLPVVPRLLDRWDDPVVHPRPFAAVTRLPGEPCTALAPGTARRLGETIATWHAQPVPDVLAGARPPAHLDAPHHQWLRRLLGAATSAGAVDEVQARFGTEVISSEVAALLRRACEHTPVLVHGDVHEDQLLLDPGGHHIVGVLDWETARADHPFWDFDLGEWGSGFWRRQRHEFDGLWRAMWAGYAQARAADPDPRPLLLSFRVRHALRLTPDADSDADAAAAGATANADPAVVGTAEEAIGAIAACARLSEDRWA